MCGISGIIDQTKQPVAPDKIKRMNDLIAHRGPDDEGFFFGKNFALGHRRLAIIDLSKDGHQPMTYRDKFTITYNGEIYNYLELRADLEKEGYRFQSKTDTEVILAAYAKWGKECVEHFNGMWAFAIHDRANNIIFCSRDRFAIKPFYYTTIRNRFCFGSEIKQFTAVPGWRPVMNSLRIFDFLNHAMLDHTEETMFSGVHQLRGGHNLIYNLSSHSYTTRRWYALESQISQLAIGEEEASDRFLDLFTDSVRLRLRSDVKVGSCLSGGLDSSAIVCIMNELLKADEKIGSQETVSSCYDISAVDEKKFIEAVTWQTQVKSHYVFPRFEDLFSSLKKLLWHQDEPFSTTSIFAQWHVFAEAKRNGLTVMLDGQGADEYLVGYHRFFECYFKQLWKNLQYLRLLAEAGNFMRMQKLQIGISGNTIQLGEITDS